MILHTFGVQVKLISFPEPRSPQKHSEALDPQTHTLYPKPQTLPKLLTWTRNLEPETLDPKPYNYTLNPLPTLRKVGKINAQHLYFTYLWGPGKPLKKERNPKPLAT